MSRRRGLANEETQTDFLDSESDAELSFASVQSRRSSTPSSPGVLSIADTTNSNTTLVNSDSEDGFVEAFNMSDDEENPDAIRRAGDQENVIAAQIHGEPRVPAQVVPPMPADPMQAIMFMLAQIQEQARQDNLRRDQQAQQDREQARHDRLQFEQQILALQAKSSSESRTATRSNGKPPVFDLEKDKPNFNTWKSKWEWHIKGAGIEKLNEPER
jgi:hypothetical protein